MASSTLQIVLTLRDQASGALRSAERAIGGFQSKVSKAAEAMRGVSTALVAGAAAAGTFKKAIDFAEEGAKFIRLRDTSRLVARAMGADMDDIVKAIQNASLGTVSQMDAMQAASRAMALGLGADADQLANLMEVAAFRGRLMGLSTTQAFSDIVTGVGRMSPLILDNLGIVVDATTTFQNYAASIGKTASELSGAEKRQALLNRVLEEGNAQLEAAGGLTLDNAAKWERLQARIDDVAIALKVRLAEGLVAWLDIAEGTGAVLDDLNTKFALWLEEMTGIRPLFELEQAQARLTEKLLEGKGAIQGSTDDLKELAAAAGLAAQEQQALVVGTQDLTAAQLGSQAMQELNQALQDGRITQGEYDTAARTVMVTLLDMSQEQVAANFALRELNQGFEEGTVSLNQYLSGVQGLNAALNETVALQEELTQFFSTPTTSSLIPGYQMGGVVPGPIGQPQLAVVHGGETISNNNMNLTINSQADSEDLQGQFQMMKALSAGAN